MRRLHRLLVMAVILGLLAGTPPAVAAPPPQVGQAMTLIQQVLDDMHRVRRVRAVNPTNVDRTAVVTRLGQWAQSLQQAVGLLQPFASVPKVPRAINHLNRTVQQLQFLAAEAQDPARSKPSAVVGIFYTAAEPDEVQRALRFLEHAF